MKRPLPPVQPSRRRRPDAEAFDNRSLPARCPSPSPAYSPRRRHLPGRCHHRPASPHSPTAAPAAPGASAETAPATRTPTLPRTAPAPSGWWTPPAVTSTSTSSPTRRPGTPCEPPRRRAAPQRPVVRSGRIHPGHRHPPRCPARARRQPLGPGHRVARKPCPRVSGDCQTPMAWVESAVTSWDRPWDTKRVPPGPSVT
jgi:hypothetical protein